MGGQRDGRPSLEVHSPGPVGFERGGVLAGYLLALGQINEAAEAATESLQDIRSVGGRPNYVVCRLEHLTLVAAERGQFEQATRLLGYLEAWYAAKPASFVRAPSRRHTNERWRC